MVTEILLRAYTYEGVSYLEQVKKLIEAHTSHNVIMVDHTHIVNDLYVELKPLRYEERRISLDKHIAKEMGCQYYRISRIFDNYGNVVGRFQDGNIEFDDRPIRIIDTDMVQGATIKLACEKFNTSDFTVPLVVKPYQDLIDMEDMFGYGSLLQCDNNITNCNYLLTPEFFAKRTSLPIELYQPFLELFGK